MKKIISVALAGNPNAGKTSLFNALTGSHHKVGNYPGVTVEKLEGFVDHGNLRFKIVDLPGIYSLTAYSLDEVVARDFLIEEKPDIVVDVLDSTNLERNLYLCLQFQELGIPVVGALNMTDEAEEKGIKINETLLSESLGIPFVKTVGTSGKGIKDLLDKTAALVASKNSKAAEHAASTKSLKRQEPLQKVPQYGEEIESRLAPLTKLIESDRAFCDRYPPRWIAIKLLENDENAIKKMQDHAKGQEIITKAESDRAWITGHFGKESEIVITEQRYGYIRGAMHETLIQSTSGRASFTEYIDRLTMNHFLGLPLFFLIIYGIFKLTFALGEYPAALLEAFFGSLATLAQIVIPEGFFRSLVVDGIIGGVGGVFSFVPLIVILFLCISILEDTGYMSRAAFLTDKALHAFGLHGQSFMPLMLGFGCSVPAIMATRTLKSPRDRIATILAVPFMSCGAKLPVYVLLAGTFFPKNAYNIVMLMYLGGVVLSMFSTMLLKRTVLRGPSTAFVMELPPYRLPTWKGVFWHVWGKTWSYIKKAGSIILVASIVIWAITTFPQPRDEVEKTQVFAADFAVTMAEASQEERDLAVERALDEYRLEYSIAGKIGKIIEPAIRPLGFNWKLGVALVPSFSAKEIVVSTLGILYGSGSEENEESESLRQALQRDPGLNPLTALTFMVFILIMPPCLASLAAIRSEAGGKWMLFQVVYSMTLAWIVSFIVRLIALPFLGA
jgi:ferrous iron transport protein B